jgi:3,4-dihydroxy 2-butanone 4-phosphate synthase / GTP cyclohydrolase II
MIFDDARVADAISAFRLGEMLIVTDDDDRENEGDLILAASHCTPEKMAFIVRHSSGIVCAPMPQKEARRLRLSPMVAENDSMHTTAFTVSVDFKHGTTTGISAEDRTNTLRNLANPNASSDDFLRPGHIFPLVAREGGVLVRSGHTEAAVDLCKLAGLPPVGVICELVNDDGTVMRGDKLVRFAASHKLRQISVAELIQYRQKRETLVTRIDSFDVCTAAGDAKAYTYSFLVDPMQHLAIVFGAMDSSAEVPVCIYAERVLSDVFAQERRLDAIMQSLSSMNGIVVYLREGSVGVRAPSYTTGTSVEKHSEARQRDRTWHEIGLGAQILRDLGIHKIRLVASKEHNYVGLDGFGIQVSSITLI